MTKTKYTIAEEDGNAYAIMGYVCMIMKREGKSIEEIDDYLEDAKSGDYHHLIEISVGMCEKLNGENENTRMVTVDWDNDGETLPTKVRIPTNVADEDVADYLSDTYGFCVNFWYE